MIRYGTRYLTTLRDIELGLITNSPEIPWPRIRSQLP